MTMSTHKELAGRLRERIKLVEDDDILSAHLFEEAADLLDSLSPPDGVGLTLETTDGSRNVLRLACKADGYSQQSIDTLDLLRDHDTLTTALAAERARGDGLAKERDAARVWHGKAKEAVEQLSDAKAKAERMEAALRSIKGRSELAFSDADDLPNHLSPDYEIVLARSIADVDAALSVQPRALLTGQDTGGSAGG